MKFSLILATCNRHDIISECFDSISKIDLSNSELELIVIDQSFDRLTFDVLNTINWKCSVLYIHALKKGLSHSRNIGLQYASGDYILLGDDDATYDSNVLNIAQSYLDKFDFISGGVYEPGTNKLTNYTKVKENKIIKRYNFCKLITSISIIVSKKLIDKNRIRFDENLGLGTDFSSCEEIDFVNRIMMLGGKGYYTTSLKIYHKSAGYYEDDKCFLYAKGHGALCIKMLKNIDFYNLVYVSIKCIKTIAKIPLTLIHPSIRGGVFFRGFLIGFINFYKKGGD